ncbi:chemotaxis protein CheA [Leptospira fletcheri]|uniref:Chemotaxis protein CheA n=1 Tax=Leptospira fletcheri TaxID=2484981 RepID=A0A4R9GBJ1_9LEPT|nr:chemotaxis protein CheW [Leptospira fletcheri]TGK09043.1 chemotaxis protein CheA [Leptospira fletcheri]
MEVDYENLLKDFVAESLELLDVSEQTSLELEKEYMPEQVNTLFRAVHTIKGNSAIFDLPSISKVSHLLENLLNNRRRTETRPSDEEVALIFVCIDEIRKMLSDLDKYKEYDITGLSDRINSFLSQLEGGDEEHRPSESKPAFGFTPIVKKPAQNESSKEKVSIPKKFLDRARQEGKSLFFLKYELQQESDLEKNGEILQAVQPIGEILLSGILNGNGAHGKGKVRHYVLLLSGFSKKEVSSIVHFPESSIMEIVKREISEEAEFSPATGRQEQIPLKMDNSNGSLQTDSYLRIPLPVLDHMINLAGETIVVRNQLLQKVESYQDHSLLSIVRNLSQLITLSQESIMRTRLQKLDSFYKKVPRLVRDLEKITGKEVELHLEGGEVELDKNIIDTISDPITHMIRNSVDHGIESAAERVAAGKPAKGNLYLSASLRGGNVILKVSDDGRGLNIGRIKEKAIERGLLTPEEVERKSQEELAELVFLPGFSTSQTVSSTSGRGVGMDVVKMNFQKAGGSVSIASNPGKGTVISATLPQTLSIINCQMVLSAGMLFAIPQPNISELILLDGKQVSTIEGKQVYQLRGHLLPLLNIRNVLRLSADSDEDSGRYIVVVHTERHRFGLIVDEIDNSEEIVVKPLTKDLSRLNLYTGAAILGDGSVGLILDISGIAKFLGLQANLLEELKISAKKEERASEQYLLFTVRGQLFGLNSKEVQRIELIDSEKVERIMNREVIQYKEEVVELCRLESYFNLKGDRVHPQNTMILLQSTEGKKGILVEEILNVADDISAFTKSDDPETGIVGSGIMFGQTIVVIEGRIVLSKVSKNLTLLGTEQED